MDYSQITQADVDGFRANLNMVPQQTESVYLPHIDADLAYSEIGKMFNVDSIGQSDPKDVDTVVPDSPEGLLEMTRRVGFLKGFHDGKFIESIQKVHQLQDPTDKVMASMRAGKMRKLDARVRDSFFAPARIGENGENVLVFPTGRIVDVASRKFIHALEKDAVPASGALPLTLGKIRTAASIIRKTKILQLLQGGKIKLALREDDVSQLLTTVPATSADYQTVKRIENGELTHAWGVDFVMDEDVPFKDGTTDVRILPMWVDKAIMLKAREIHTATITPRGDKSMRPYAYYETEAGAARGWDEAVAGIEVKDIAA
ncbi:phage capsid protein [Brevundimonas sp.]|uniref:phage capsid protein n=1 Tax=Brevundimonas sp. TaxID=1871086 RepID=UPI00289CF005|nr:phage capsid protein [Brevundimonas sp.]